jgi:phage tail-like protein
MTNQLIHYLPEIYRRKGAVQEGLQAFLGVFESVMDELDLTIDAIPTYFDPEQAPEGFYPWLAQWLSLDLYELLGDRNRQFILKAYEFYKKKGTAGGIEELVTFLTGKKCRVKEFTRSVFRSWGMDDAEGSSRTVDDSDPRLLSRIGSFDDSLHYVHDNEAPGVYAQDVIGVYIFLIARERDFIIKEEQLYKIINSFLPVFVRAEIFIVEENYEVYEVNRIDDPFMTRVRGSLIENPPAVTGVYTDSVSWNRFHSFDEDDPRTGFTNDVHHRTDHDETGKEIKL